MAVRLKLRWTKRNDENKVENKPATKCGPFDNLNLPAKNMVKTVRKTMQKDGRELQLVTFWVSIQTGDNAESQLGLMVDILYQWYKKYGAACKEFTIRFFGPKENHEALMTFLPSLIQQEEPLHPLFAQLGQVTVIFVSPNGIVMKESKLLIG